MEKCWKCDTKLKVIKDKPYHYTECGLDNIYLHGIIQYECSKCRERGAEIPKINELHLLIGGDVVCQKALLTGDEVRFLRKELGMKSKDMAFALSIKPETYSRWENTKKVVSPCHDKNLRLLYVLNASAQEGRILHKSIRKMLRDVAIGPATATRREFTPAEWLGQTDGPIFRDACERY
jgi:putative transcriptional regulator